MRDGIYKVSLASGDRKGLIIGTVHEGLITGCDQTHHVTGRVSHARPEGFVEIANLDTITVRFAGICGESFGQFDARIAENPDLNVQATFQWMCEF